MKEQRRPRLLIETPREEWATADVGLFEAAEFEVQVCPGPDRHECPLLEYRSCSLLDEADVMLYDLDLDDEVDRTVLARIRASYPQLPVVAELTTEEQREHARDLDGVNAVVPYDQEHLRDAVVAVVNAQA
jgi:hypothetical protein